jgi:hypothetical protein
MPLIVESIVTTVDRGGRAHIAPLGLIAEAGDWIIASFRPSTTLDNLHAVPHAVASHVDDVRVFAGCLTGRSDWPLAPTGGPAPRLAAALSHWELAVAGYADDAVRPRFRMRVETIVEHAPAAGFNRARAAVIELAILVSRLAMLPRDKVRAETAYLRAAVEKTGGDAELEAWGWLVEKMRAFYGGDP